MANDLVPINWAPHTEVYHTDETDTDWPGTGVDIDNVPWPAHSFRTDVGTTNVQLPAFYAQPGDYIVGNLGSEYVYTITDDQSGATVLTITFGAINNGDGTFTIAPYDPGDNSDSIAPDSPLGTTIPYATTPSDLVPNDTYGSGHVNNISTYCGPYATLPSSQVMDLGNDLIEYGIDLLAIVDTQKDVYSDKYPIRMADGSHETSGLDLGDNIIGRTHKHHQNWENGHFINTLFYSDLTGTDMTELFIGTNNWASPKYVPDGPIPAPVSESGPVIVVKNETVGSNPNPPHNGTVFQAVSLFSESATTFNPDEIYMEKWPFVDGSPNSLDAPKGAYVFLDYLTNSYVDGSGAHIIQPTWYTAPSSTDITADVFINKIKVGVMSEDTDAQGKYILHPVNAGVSGIDASGNRATIPDGSLKREKDYPHKPHTWEFDGFHLEFDPAKKFEPDGVTSAHKYVNVNQSGNIVEPLSGYTDVVHIVAEGDESGTEPPAITQFTSSTVHKLTQIRNDVISNSVVSPSWTFLARPNWFIVFNTSGSTINLINNMIAEQQVATDRPGFAGNPSTYAFGAGEMRCVYWHPGKEHSDLLVIGRISKTVDKTRNHIAPNGYLFIRGWHHGNNINPDHIPPNIFVRENDFPSDWSRFRHTGFHFEIGASSDYTTLDTSSDSGYSGKPMVPSPVYIVQESITDATGAVTYLTPTVEVYDPSNPAANAQGIIEQTVPPPYTVDDSTVAPNTAFTAKAGYLLVWNHQEPGDANIDAAGNRSGTGGIIVLGAPNVTGSGGSTIGPKSFAAIRFTPTHKELSIWGHFSHKVDQNGLLFIVGSKHGIARHSPYLIGNNQLPIEVDTPNKPQKWQFDNFHFEFTKAKPTLSNQSTCNMYLDGGVSRKISFQDDNAPVFVLDNAFLFYPGDYIVFNNTGASWTPPVGDTGEYRNNSAYVNGRAILNGYMQALSQKPQVGTGTSAHDTAVPRGIWVIGQVIDTPDTSGYLYIKGWHHGVMPVSGKNQVMPGSLDRLRGMTHNLGNFHVANCTIQVSKFYGGVTQKNKTSSVHFFWGEGNDYNADTATTSPTGSNYGVVRIITDPDTGDATYYPIVNHANGGIQGVKVTSGGSGYSQSSPPTVTISGGSGTGATAVAVVNSSGAVAKVYMTNYGGGYTGTPTVSFSSGSATATILKGWSAGPAGDNLSYGDYIGYNSDKTNAHNGVPPWSLGRVETPPVGSYLDDHIFLFGQVNDKVDKTTKFLSINGFHVGLHQVHGKQHAPGSTKRKSLAGHVPAMNMTNAFILAVVSGSTDNTQSPPTCTLNWLPGEMFFPDLTSMTIDSSAHATDADRVLPEISTPRTDVKAGSYILTYIGDASLSGGSSGLTYVTPGVDGNGNPCFYDCTGAQITRGPIDTAGAPADDSGHGLSDDYFDDYAVVGKLSTTIDPKTNQLYLVGHQHGSLPINSGQLAPQIISNEAFSPNHHAKVHFSGAHIAATSQQTIAAVHDDASVASVAVSNTIGRFVVLTEDGSGHDIGSQYICSVPDVSATSGNPTTVGYRDIIGPYGDTNWRSSFVGTAANAFITFAATLPPSPVSVPTGSSFYLRYCWTMSTTLPFSGVQTGSQTLIESALSARIGISGTGTVVLPPCPAPWSGASVYVGSYTDTDDETFVQHIVSANRTSNTTFTLSGTSGSGVHPSRGFWMFPKGTNINIPNHHVLMKIGHLSETQGGATSGDAYYLNTYHPDTTLMKVNRLRPDARSLGTSDRRLLVTDGATVYWTLPATLGLSGGSGGGTVTSIIAGTGLSITSAVGSSGGAITDSGTLFNTGVTNINSVKGAISLHNGIVGSPSHSGWVNVDTNSGINPNMIGLAVESITPAGANVLSGKSLSAVGDGTTNFLSTINTINGVTGDFASAAGGELTLHNGPPGSSSHSGWISIQGDSTNHVIGLSLESIKSDGTNVTNGYRLSANGSGGVNWTAPGAGGGVSDINSVSGSISLHNGDVGTSSHSGFINITNDVTNHVIGLSIESNYLGANQPNHSVLVADGLGGVSWKPGMPDISGASNQFLQVNSSANQVVVGGQPGRHLGDILYVDVGNAPGVSGPPYDDPATGQLAARGIGPSGSILYSGFERIPAGGSFYGVPKWLSPSTANQIMITTSIPDPNHPVSNIIGADWFNAPPANQVLISNASGNLRWSALPSNLINGSNAGWNQFLTSNYPSAPGWTTPLQKGRDTITLDGSGNGQKSISFNPLATTSLAAIQVIAGKASNYGGTIYVDQNSIRQTQATVHIVGATSSANFAVPFMWIAIGF